MIKEKFQSVKEEIKEAKKALDDKLERLKAHYIKHSAPCKIGDKVIVHHLSDRKEKMIVKEFHILKDEVFIYSFNAFNADGSINSAQRFIHAGHGRIEILE